MVHLTLTGLSRDKARLVLVSDAGVEFTLDIDARLRAALRGDEDRLGQLEITMESTLRPRDIQSRIRAGASPDEVARLAQTTVERIMGFVAPVLAERAHVAERAQTSSLRRRSDGSGGGARTLGEAVAAHLAHERLAPDTVEWDAWRRDDGRWVLVGAFVAPKRRGTATFSYDVRGNYVVAEDDAARWLIGEEPAAGTSARDDLQQARRRRAARVSVSDALLDIPLEGDGERGALGDDAIALVDDAARREQAAEQVDEQGTEQVDEQVTEPGRGQPQAAEAPDAAEADALPDALPDGASAPEGELETLSPARVSDREPTVDLTDVADAVRRGEGAPGTPDAPHAAAPLPVEPGEAVTREDGDETGDQTGDQAGTTTGTPAAETAGTAEGAEAPEPPAPRRTNRRRRASVPSWDEIMFGGGGGSTD